MKKTKFFVLYFDPVVEKQTESLKELNALLEDGWKPVRETPFGRA